MNKQALSTCDFASIPRKCPVCQNGQNANHGASLTCCPLCGNHQGSRLYLVSCARADITIAYKFYYFCVWKIACSECNHAFWTRPRTSLVCSCGYEYDWAPKGLRDTKILESLCTQFSPSARWLLVDQGVPEWAKAIPPEKEGQ